MKKGDILISETRDAVILTTSHMSGWYVKDCLYNEETQTYEPTGKEYLLTFYELKKDFRG